MARLANSQE